MHIKYFTLGVFIMLFIYACNEQPSLNNKVVKKEDISKISRNKTSHIRGESEDDNIASYGVLLISSDSLYETKQKVDVINYDGSIFTTIESSQENEPASNKLDGKILAYFPDYFVIHFYAKKVGIDTFKVKVGTSLKLIKSSQYTQYISLQEYILKYYVTTTKSNPLRTKPDDNATEIKVHNYDELNFNCLEISGDWVRIICNEKCEGCPEGGKLIEGWIRWKKDNEIIIRQYYSC